jgi:hypothetical protein
MDLYNIGWEDVDWSHVVHYRDQWRDLVNTVMKLRVPYEARSFWLSDSYWRKALLRGVPCNIRSCDFRCSAKWNTYVNVRYLCCNFKHRFLES